MIIRKKFLKVFIVLLALAMLLPYAPIKAITIDSENEYNLYIDDYPSDLSSVYAKFKTSKKNNEDYALNLIEDDEEEFIKAISNLKIDVEEENIALGFTTELIYTDPESGDDSKKTDAVIVLCSLPDDAQEHPDDCLFYQISGGKAKLVPSQRVKDEEGVIYEKFELPSYGMYGFVYKNPDSYEEEDDEDGNDDDNDDGDENDGDDDDDDDGDDDDNDEDIKKYTGNNHDPIEPEDDSRFEYTEDDDTDDDGFEYTEDDDDDFDSDDFGSDDGTIEEFDSDAEDDDDDVPYYYEKEDDIGYYTEDKSKTNAEAGNTGNNENSSSSSSVSENAGSQTDTSDHHVLDNTGSTEYDFNTSGRTSTTDTSYSGAVPKTGDEFPLTETISIGAISLVLLIGTIILLKKKH